MIINVNCPEWQVRLVRDSHWQDTVEGPISLKVPDSILKEIEVDSIDGRVYVVINEQGYFSTTATVEIKEDK